MRYRDFAFAGVIVLAALPFFAASAKGSHGIRISAGPGVSFAVPEGWMACDVANNRLLGNADHPKVLERACARLNVGGRKLGLIDSDQSDPLAIVSLYSRNDGFPDEFVASATPETIQFVSDVFCDEMFKGSFKIDGCTIRKETVGGKIVFVGEARGRDASGHEDGLEIYILSGPAGSAILSFMTQLPMNANVKAKIASIVSTIRIEPAPPEGPPEFVTLTVAPGVTMSVPRGWMSCDAANNALLASTGDPVAMAPNLCGAPDIAKEVAVFDPRPFHNVIVEAIVTSAQIDNDTFARTLAPDELARSRDANCKDMFQPMMDHGYGMVSCDMAAGTVGGHPARITTIVSSSKAQPNAPATQIEFRTLDILYNNGVLRFVIQIPTMLKPITQAASDALVNSIVIQ